MRMTYIVGIIAIMMSSVSVADASQSVRRVGTWDSPPTIVICDDVTVSQRDMMTVLRWWEELGAEFGPVIRDPRHDSCEQISRGVVTITHTLLGASTKRRARDEKMIWAKIRLPADTPTLILAHEIGHALGWTHTRQMGHVMNGRYSEAGWFSGGLHLGPAKAFPGARGPRRGGGSTARPR